MAQQLPLDSEGITSDLEKFISGSFSDIYKGKYKNRDVVVKKNNQQQYHLNEIKIHSKLSHPGIVQLLAYSTDSIILEYVSDKDLFILLDDVNYPQTPFSQRLGWLRQISAALKYLHSIHIIHHDIKIDNCLIDSSERIVKLCDFGFSVQLEPGTSCKCSNGSFRYCSPELSIGREHDCEIDIYAFGVVAWEIYTGDMAYGEMKSQEILRLVSIRETPTIPENCPPQYKILLAKCWSLSNTRIKSNELHEFLEKWVSCIHTEI